MKNIIHSKNFLILLSSLPILLITGPFLSDLLVTTSAIFFIFFIFIEKKINYLKNNFFYFLLLFNIICILSSLLSSNILLSFESSLFYLRIIIFAFLVSYLINYNQNILKYFYNILLFCFCILILDGFTQYFFGINILFMGTTYGRVSSFFGDEFILGSYLVRLFPLFFGLFLIKKKVKYEIFFIAVIFILLDILVFITGERTAFYLLNISSIFIIILIKEYKLFRLITFIISLVLIFFITLSNEKIKNRMIDDPIRTFNLDFNNEIEVTKNEDNISTMSNFKAIYQSAWQMFLEKPIIGYGPKIFREACKKYNYSENQNGCSTHPHNFYLQILSETGILGFSFIFFAFLYVLKESFLIFINKKRASSYEVCLLACFVITLWPLSPNGNFFNNWLMIVYSLPLGFYLNVKIFPKLMNNK